MILPDGRSLMEIPERFTDWVEKDGYGQFRLIGPIERFIVDTATTAVTTGTFVNTVGGTITLEPYAMLGNGVSLLTGSHDINAFGTARMHGTNDRPADIIIRRGAWVANNCTVIGPCDIGENAVVTAGTVVRGVVPAYAVIGPQPWRIIRMLEPKEEPMIEEELAQLGNRDASDFDRNWAGPVALKPRTYRSQLEKDTWYAVVVGDEYHCPGFQAEDVVLDIGGHIGSFSWLAHRRGSRNVYAFEPNTWHHEALVQNVEGLDGVTVANAAMVRSDDARALRYAYAKDTWTVLRGHGDEVESFSLDEVIGAVGPVRFLKIDVEGSEFPILYTCTKLDQIQQMAGEYHPMSNPLDMGAEMAGLPPCTIEALTAFLAEKGFYCEYKPDRVGDPTSLGRFFAKRV